jgi:hypothetical protein
MDCGLSLSSESPFQESSVQVASSWSPEFRRSSGFTARRSKRRSSVFRPWTVLLPAKTQPSRQNSRVSVHDQSVANHVRDSPLSIKFVFSALCRTQARVRSGFATICATTIAANQPLPTQQTLDIHLYAPKLTRHCGKGISNFVGEYLCCFELHRLFLSCSRSF